MHPAFVLYHLPQFVDGYLPTLPYRPVYLRCLVAVQTRIRALKLPGIPDASVVLRKAPWSREFTQGTLALPAIVISPEGAESAAGAGTNLRDDVGYGVLLTMLAADNEQLTGSLASPLAWRERIARSFRHRRLPEVDEVIGCQIEPRVVVGPQAYPKGLLHSALVLRFISRERRAP